MTSVFMTSFMTLYDLFLRDPLLLQHIIAFDIVDRIILIRTVLLDPYVIIFRVVRTGLPQAIVDLVGPAADLASLPVDLDGPAVNLEGPGVDLEGPDVDIVGPVVDLGVRL